MSEDTIRRSSASLRPKGFFGKLKQRLSKRQDKSARSPHPTVSAKISNPSTPTSRPSTPKNGLVRVVPSSRAASSTAFIAPRSQSLWEQALSRLSADEKALIVSLGTPQNRLDVLNDVLTAVADKRDQVIDRQWTVVIRGKPTVLRHVADKIINWVQKFVAVGDVLSQYDPVLLSPPWAAIRFLLQLGINDSEKMGVILVAVEKLTNLLHRCELYEGLHVRNNASPTKGQENLAVALVELYAAILEFLADCRGYLTRNTAVRSISFTQSMDMDKIESAERVVALEFEVAEAENQRHAHTELTEMIQVTLRTMLKEVSAPLKGIGDNVSFVRDAIEDKKRIEILNWYSKVEYVQHHNRAREDRVQDTGEWLFNHEQYRKWSTSNISRVLWLHGIPGSGKTKLASAVIDRLLAQLKPGCSIAYHYCSRGEADRVTVESIMRSVIRQLSTQGPGAGGIDSNVLDDYNRRSLDGFTSGKPNLTECCSLLSKLLGNRTEPCYLVIDALDETDKANRREFLSSLFATAKSAPVKVEIFITSRDEQDIVRWMKSIEDLPSLYIGAGAKDNAGDLERYVRGEIDRVIANADLLNGNVDNLLREKICNTLISRADAMFLWCRYQIIHLCGFEFRSEVENELDVLPRTMDETYSRIYDVILKQRGMSLEIGIASLSWVTWGYRPLTVPEFLDAVYLEVRQKIKLSRDELTQDLVQKCSGYMVVADVQAGVFRPAHLTIVEYIEARQVERFFSFHQNAALACLRRLIEHSNPRFDRGIPGDSLKAYAVIYWWSHTHRSSPKSTLDAELIKVLTKFFGDAAKPGKPYLYWYNAAKEWHAVTINSGPTELSDQLNHVFSDPISPLFSAAQWGLYVPAMWESDFNPEIRNTENESLLYLASTCLHKRDGGLGSSCGHFDVARRILERGADANGQGGYNGYALAQAIDSADIKLVDILLKYGAKVDVRASEWSSMLQLAAWREAYDGSGGITELLINNGADVNHCSGYYNTALQACAEVGSTDMISLLLDKGADPNILGGRWNSAIQASLISGRDEVTSLLLKADADVTVRDNDPNRDYATALITACDGDPTMEIFEELISHMTLEDINGPPCGYHGIPLGLAAMNEERYPLVDHLLEAGADPNLTGGVFGSFAGAAAYHFTLENLTKAESIGADCDLPAGYWGTPLAIACWSSHVPPDGELISWFLRWGADVNRLHGVYGTPLQCAAASGKLEYVKQLLAAGADVNLFSPQGYGSPLQAAISTGSDEIEALLRSKGAALNPAFDPSTENPPCRWSATLCESQITVSDDGLTASYFTDTWIPATVLSDNPIPLSCEYFYFEVTVLLPQPGDHLRTPNPRVAIGLALDGIYMRSRPGMNTCVESWGYHSEDGGTYAAMGIDPAMKQHRGPRWKEGDTVGMGVFPRRRLAFYTKNGKFMGIGAVALKGRLHPAVGMSTEARLRANFGQEEFMYKGRKDDLELTADMVGKCGEIRKDESLLLSKYG